MFSPIEWKNVILYGEIKIDPARIWSVPLLEGKLHPSRGHTERPQGARPAVGWPEGGPDACADSWGHPRPAS